jgi:hypothetical protein
MHFKRASRSTQKIDQSTHTDCSTPDPQTWTEEQLIVWLKEHRNTQPSGKETREELLAMVESALHTPEAGVGGWRD